MKEIQSYLEKSPLFQGIQPQDIPGMLGCIGAKLLEKEKGQIIFREGDDATFLGIVLYGAVTVTRTDYYGNRSIVGHIGPGELFGESYAFSGVRELPVAVQADTHTRYLLMDSRKIYTCCGNACQFHNRLIANLLGLVATKNLMLHQKIQITSQRTTREKLMAYLLAQATLQNREEFTIPFDRQSLADYLEVDRSGLSAEIGKLKKEGILDCKKNRFRLL